MIRIIKMTCLSLFISFGVNVMAQQSEAGVSQAMDTSKQVTHMIGDIGIVRNHLPADTAPGAKGTIVRVEIDMTYVWRFINNE